MPVPQVGEEFKLVVGNGKTEMRTADAALFTGSAFVYASKNDGETWWAIPTNIGVLNERTICFYLTGKEKLGEYERCEFSFPFFMIYYHIL